MTVSVNERGSLCCDHDGRAVLCKRTLSNRTTTYCMQCLDCGVQVGGAVAHARLGQLMIRFKSRSPLPAWDDELRKGWFARCRARYDEQRAERDAGFWARYDEHLASPRWRDLRRRVLARCDNLCEGCGLARAVQVHHLTYERLGDEMLFDLVAVCLACHQRIHPHRDFGAAGEGE